MYCRLLFSVFDDDVVRDGKIIIVEILISVLLWLCIYAPIYECVSWHRSLKAGENAEGSKKGGFASHNRQ